MVQNQLVHKELVCQITVNWEVVQNVAMGSYDLGSHGTSACEPDEMVGEVAEVGMNGIGAYQACSAMPLRICGLGCGLFEGSGVVSGHDGQSGLDRQEDE